MAGKPARYTALRILTPRPISLLLQPVLLDLPIQRPLADAQHLGRLFAIAGRQRERLGHEQPLDFGERLADQRAERGRRTVRRQAPRGPANSSGKSSTSSSPS